MRFKSQIFCPNCDFFVHLIEKMDGYICENCRRILIDNCYKRKGIEAGDEVIVIRPGSCYDMYVSFSNLYQLENWVSGEVPEMSVIHKVLLVAPHDTNTNLCYVIEDLYYGKQYIIGGEGIKKICSVDETGIQSLQLEEELFEI